MLLHCPTILLVYEIISVTLASCYVDHLSELDHFLRRYLIEQYYSREENERWTRYKIQDADSIDLPDDVDGTEDNIRSKGYKKTTGYSDDSGSSEHTGPNDSSTSDGSFVDLADTSPSSPSLNLFEYLPYSLVGRKNRCRGRCRVRGKNKYIRRNKNKEQKSNNSDLCSSVEDRVEDSPKIHELGCFVPPSG